MTLRGVYSATHPSKPQRTMDLAAPEQPHRKLPRRLSGLLTDGPFFIAVVAGLFVVWGMVQIAPQTAAPLLDGAGRYLLLLLIFPVLEEILFRGLLQGMVAQRLSGRLGPLSHANLIVSLLFALAHFYSHSAAWALGTVFPSLVFGYFRDRYQHVLPAVVLHVFYNASYFFYPML